MSPYFFLGYQLHPLNKASNSNQNMTQARLDFFGGNGSAHLVSVAADGVGCDSKFIWWRLIKFLRGKICYVSLVDSNQNSKNFLYHFIGVSCIVVVGIHVVDPHLFMFAGIPNYIWRVKDWASEGVVLTMASGHTV